MERFGTKVSLPHHSDFLLPHQSGKPTVVHILLAFHTIIKWFGLEGTLKIINCKLPAMSRDT